MIKKPDSLGYKILLALLLLGVIIPLGLLSYWGVLAIYPTAQIAAWVAFFLNGVVDGEVYLDNISGGLRDWRFLGDDGRDVLIIKLLDAYLSKEAHWPSATTSSEFEREYFKARKALDKDPDDEVLQKKVADLRRRFLDRVLNRKKSAFFGDEKPRGNNSSFELLKKHVRANMRGVRIRVWLLRAAVVISILAGIGFGLVTVSSFVALAGSSIWLMMAACPLGVMAMLGFSVFTFHNMKRIIFNDTFDKWRARLQDWFVRKEHEHFAIYAVRLVAASILVPAVLALSVIATLTTGYTWWIAIESPRLRALFVFAGSVATSIFTLNNAFDAVDGVLHWLKHFMQAPFKGLRHSLSEMWQRENIMQIINPFRLMDKIVTFVFENLLVVAHALAVGLVGDRFPGWEMPSLACNTATDILTDGPYFTHQHHHHHLPKGEAFRLEDEDDHHHHTIPQILQNYVLDPLLYIPRRIAIGWDCLWSDDLSWDDAYYKYFPEKRQAPVETSIATPASTARVGEKLGGCHPHHHHPVPAQDKQFEDQRSGLQAHGLLSANNAPTLLKPQDKHSYDVDKEVKKNGTEQRNHR